MWLLLTACFVGNPTALQLMDGDGDGFWPAEARAYGAKGPWDCDDSNPEIFPGQIEECNGTDDDCDNDIDEACPNADFGIDFDMMSVIDKPPNTEVSLLVSGVGDDSLPSVTWTMSSDIDGELAVAERTYAGNRVTFDVDLSLGEHTLTAAADWLGAETSDTFAVVVADVDQDDDGQWSQNYLGDDCDDQNPDIYAGADEICNGTDDDCDDSIDENLDCIAEHCGAITEDENWSSDLDHWVTCPVSISDGATLTIEAGTLVRFDANAGLAIGENSPGALSVLGTPENPIALTSSLELTSPGAWAGIVNHSFGSTLVQNTDIQYAASVTSLSDNFEISNSNVQFGGGQGFLFQDSDATLTNVTIANNNVGIVVESSAVSMYDSTIEDNGVGLDCLAGPCFSLTTNGNVYFNNGTSVRLASVPLAGSLPSDLYADPIRVLDGEVTTSMVLLDHGAPYQFFDDLHIIGGPDSVELHVDEAEVQLMEGGTLIIDEHGVLSGEQSIFSGIPGGSGHVAGEWEGIRLDEGGSLNLFECDVGYGINNLSIQAENSGVAESSVHDALEYGVYWTTPVKPGWIEQGTNTFTNNGLGASNPPP